MIPDWLKDLPVYKATEQRLMIEVAHAYRSGEPESKVQAASNACSAISEFTTWPAIVDSRFMMFLARALREVKPGAAHKGPFGT